MTPGRIGILLLMLIGINGMSAAVCAGQVDNSLRPAIPAGRGETCVEDTDFMRRNHMELLRHQRDETVLKGHRNEKHSLEACLDCHAVTGPDAQPVTISDQQHFCRSCHDFAAVSIDCFQCHASRPRIENEP